MPFLLRRIHGQSMHPTLRSGKIIFALKVFKRLNPGDLVIVRHNGVEKIKRVKLVTDSKLYIVGDNESASTDSRQFGWLDRSVVLAKVITWNNANRSSSEMMD